MEKKREGVRKKKWVPIPLFSSYRHREAQLRHVGRAQQLFPFQPWLTLSLRDDTLDSSNVKGDGNHGNPRAPPSYHPPTLTHPGVSRQKRPLLKNTGCCNTIKSSSGEDHIGPRGFLLPTSATPEISGGKRNSFFSSSFFLINSNQQQKKKKREGSNTRSKCVPIL